MNNTFIANGKSTVKEIIEAIPNKINPIIKITLDFLSFES